MFWRGNYWGHGLATVADEVQHRDGSTTSKALENASIQMKTGLTRKRKGADCNSDGWDRAAIQSAQVHLNRALRAMAFLFIAAMISFFLLVSVFAWTPRFIFYAAIPLFTASFIYLIRALVLLMRQRPRKETIPHFILSWLIQAGLFGAYVFIVFAVVSYFPLFGLELFPETQSEKAAETLTLSTGEILTNESFLSVGRDSVQTNKLFFQQSASSPRESLGEIIEEDAAPLSLHNANPQLQRSRDRVTLIMGSHIFQRWLREGGPYWYHASTNPNPAASVFLRSFLKPGDSRIAIPSGRGFRGWFDIPRLEVPYAFDRIDLDQNVLVTHRNSSDATFPEFLVYSAVQYGFTWCFDIERTRSANHLKPPFDSNILIEFSVVTYPGKLKFDGTRDSVLALRGAKEIHGRTLPLNSSTWTTTECSVTIPDGTTIKERFDVLLGFLDPSPEYLSIFWRRHPVLWDDWHFIKLGDWVRADATGFEGDLSRVVFFRVRLNQPQ